MRDRAAERSAAEAEEDQQDIPGLAVAVAHREFLTNRPPNMIAALDAAGDDAANVGVELVAPLIDQIRTIPGIAGIHVMAMGHDEETRDLVTRAGLLPRPVS